jgi:hypothetical protein
VKNFVAGIGGAMMRPLQTGFYFVFFFPSSERKKENHTCAVVGWSERK